MSRISYGWLSPKGEFFPSKSPHEKWAVDYVLEHGHLAKAYFDTELSERFGCGNFLEKRGWILVHNPSGVSVEIHDYYRKLTKKQREFLWDYFIKLGLEEKAMEVWEM